MNKKFTAIATGIAMLFAIGCKKENENPTYNPAGFWRGNAYSLIHLATFLQPNGKANIYIRVMGHDTASALVKSYGYYTVSGNTVKAYGVFNDGADTAYIQTILQSDNQMTGDLFMTTSGELVDCKLKRE